MREKTKSKVKLRFTFFLEQMVGDVKTKNVNLSLTKTRNKFSKGHQGQTIHKGNNEELGVFSRINQQAHSKGTVIKNTDFQGSHA